MGVVSIEVRSRVAGGRAAEPALEPVILQLLEERVSVAELIRRTVEEQVRELTVKRKLGAREARRALDRQYLTDDEVAAQAGRGAVRFPSERAVEEPRLDPEAEVRKALDAFRAKRYVILVDGRPVEGLEEELTFAPGTRVTFLRLTPLVGG